VGLWAFGWLGSSRGDEASDRGSGRLLGGFPVGEPLHMCVGADDVGDSQDCGERDAGRAASSRDAECLHMPDDRSIAQAAHEPLAGAARWAAHDRLRSHPCHRHPPSGTREPSRVRRHVPQPDRGAP